MEKLLIFVLIGLGAQLVDGTLGMAFGVTATTLFVLSGTGAATASAVVHVAEVGITAVSGLSHWRFGNVDWPRVAQLGIPGSISAFVGATALSTVSADAARPITSTILLLLGVWVVVKFAFLSGRQSAAVESVAGFPPFRLVVLGVFGGLLDSTGGGGWGPVTTSTLMSVEAREPRKIIGTVSAAEFLVAAGAVAGFLPRLNQEFHAHTGPVVGLLIGGVIAAPIAALLVGRLDQRLLGVVIGGVLVALNVRTLLAGIVPAPVLFVALAGWVVLIIAIAPRAKSGCDKQTDLSTVSITAQ